MRISERRVNEKMPGPLYKVCEVGLWWREFRKNSGDILYMVMSPEGAFVAQIRRRIKNK